MNKQKMPVFIYCDFLQPGGVERVSVRLSRLLLQSGFPCYTVSQNKTKLFEQVPCEISKIPAYGSVILFSRKSDIISLYKKIWGNRLIYWRHIPFDTQKASKGIIDKVFVFFMSWLGTVTCVCEELENDMQKIPGANRNNIVSCYSPIDIPSYANRNIQIIELSKPIKLVYFGREGHQKRLTDVVAMVEHANKKDIEVKLSVYGYSDKPNYIAKQAYVDFLGSTNQPLEVLKLANGLILVSEFEGFPTAMVEAACCGIPIFCNQFRTGLTDFENKIGPTNRITQNELGSLASAIFKQKRGVYSLESLSNQNILKSWTKIIEKL